MALSWVLSWRRSLWRAPSRLHHRGMTGTLTASFVKNPEVIEWAE
jgi:hypothetical protein